MDDIAGVVDVEREGFRPAPVAIQGVGQADHVAQARRRSFDERREGRWARTQAERAVAAMRSMGEAREP